MARKAYEALESTIEAVSETLDQLDRRSERMEVVLMVREPGSAVAADAYEGLRRQVVAAVEERFAHLAQLVQFDAAIRNGADLTVLNKMVTGWCEAANLALITDPAHPQAEELYEVVEDNGGPLTVVDPAYVDQTSGRIVRRGRAARSRIEQEVTLSTPAGTSEPEQSAPSTGGLATSPNEAVRTEPTDPARGGTP